MVLMRARSHIQKMAPAPPMERATAMPAMLPIPTVLASAVDVAWKGVILPFFRSFSSAVVRKALA